MDKTNILRANPNNGENTKRVKWDPSRDASLSFRSRGILYYLLLKPDNWTCSIKDIVKQGTESDYAVRNAIKELVEAGYITRKHVKEGGKFAGSYYEYSDVKVYKK